MIYIHNFWCNQEQKEALDREEKRAKLCSIPSGIENITSSTFKRKVVEFLNCASCHHATKRESCKEKASHQGGLFVADMSVKRALRNTLLEDLAVGEVVGLAVDGDRLVPGPHVVDELLVLLLGGVELGELVGGHVGSNLEGGGGVLATDDKGTLDDGVVGLAEDGTGTEDVLAAALETGEEATDLVVAHESHGELLVVEVVEAPDRELVELAVLPEPGKGDLTGLLVRVLALPVKIVSKWY